MSKNLILENVVNDVMRLPSDSGKVIPNVTIRIIRKSSCRGYFVSFMVDNNVYIGWSLCDKKDAFNKLFGYELAVTRAINTFNKSSINVASSLEPEFIKLIGRIYRYFRFKENKYNFPTWFDYLIKENPWLTE